MKQHQQTFKVWNGDKVPFGKFKHNPRSIRSVHVHSCGAYQYNIKISPFDITVVACNNQCCKVKFTVYYECWDDYVEPP